VTTKNEEDDVHNRQLALILRRTESFASFGGWDRSRTQTPLGASPQPQPTSQPPDQVPLPPLPETRPFLQSEGGHLPIYKNYHDTAFYDKIILWLYGWCYTMELDENKELEIRPKLRKVMTFLGLFIGTMPELEALLDYPSTFLPLRFFSWNCHLFILLFSWLWASSLS